VASTSEVGEKPEIVVLAVKPQSMDAVLPDLKRFADEGSVFLSIAAGKTLRYFAVIWAPPPRSCAPCPTRRGSAPGHHGRHAIAGRGSCEKKRCNDLLEAVGQVLWIETKP